MSNPMSSVGGESQGGRVPLAWSSWDLLLAPYVRRAHISVISRHSRPHYFYPPTFPSIRAALTGRC